VFKVGVAPPAGKRSLPDGLNPEGGSHEENCWTNRQDHSDNFGNNSLDTCVCDVSRAGGEGDPDHFGDSRFIDGNDWDMPVVQLVRHEYLQGEKQGFLM
jgi:hypothetical protein